MGLPPKHLMGKMWSIDYIVAFPLKKTCERRHLALMRLG